MKVDITVTGVIILAAAVLSFVSGIALYLWAVRSSSRMGSANIIAWLLMALFPVLLLFSFFPSSSTFDWKVQGVSIGGAIGAFIFIWWRGAKVGDLANSLQAQTAKVRELEERIGRAQAAQAEPRRSSKLDPSASRTYRLLKQNRKIVLFAGGIDELKGAEIWVNSENTNMQMARFYDRSISGTIRYRGAKKDGGGDVTEDIVADALGELMKDRKSVHAGTVLATGSGELEKTHGVKMILHAAAVQGQVGSGYRPIENIDCCVVNALDAALSKDVPKPGCRSIAFPLFGTGTGRGDVRAVVRPLLERAIHHLSDKKDCPIQTIYFVTWGDVEMEACAAVLDSHPAVQAA